MSTSLSRLVTEEVHRELPMPAVVYGIIALALFFVLLGVLWSFRGTAQKIRGVGHPDAGGHH